MYDDLPSEYQRITKALGKRLPTDNPMILNTGDNDESPEIVASPTIKSRPPHQFKITLVLARNLYPRLSDIPDGQAYKEYRAEEGSVTWIEEWHRAVGTFITMLESHGFDEEESKNHLSVASSVNL